MKTGALPREFGVEEADFADLVNAALTRYSKDRPLVSFADFAGDGETFDFPLPPDWDDSLSFIRAVEYPQGKRIPTYLLKSAWIHLCERNSGGEVQAHVLRPSAWRDASSVLHDQAHGRRRARERTRKRSDRRGLAGPPRRAATCWPAASPSPRPRPSRRIRWTTRASLGNTRAWAGNSSANTRTTSAARKAKWRVRPARLSIGTRSSRWGAAEYFTHGASGDR